MSEKKKEDMIKEAVEEAKASGEVVDEEELKADPIIEEAKQEKENSKKKKSKKQDKKDEKIEELTDKLTRQMAEFENFRKRTDKEKSKMYEIGAKDIVEKILPVIDNFERGLEAVTEEEKSEPFVQGMEMIYKQLITSLEEVGVKPIDALGQEFNPDFHNAVMHVEDESLGENVVAEELQKGYMYKDTVVRFSMVKVAN
ncbi:molecular chaperone GrpE [Aequitasia blattaphilus]